MENVKKDRTEGRQVTKRKKRRMEGNNKLRKKGHKNRKDDTKK